MFYRTLPMHSFFSFQADKCKKETPWDATAHDLANYLFSLPNHKSVL